MRYSVIQPAIVIALFGIALFMTLPRSAGAHCYSIWHYSTPQNCGGAHAATHLHGVYLRASMAKPAAVPVLPGPDPIDILRAAMIAQMERK